MRFLLMIISLIFSFLFFFFYVLKNNGEFFGYIKINGYNLVSLSPNLLFSAGIFFLLSIFFFFYFSNFTHAKIITTKNKKTCLKVMSLVYFGAILYHISYLFTSYLYFFGIICFLSSIFIFNFLLDYPSPDKKILKYIGIFCLYFGDIFLILYLLTHTYLNILIGSTLMYSILFNLFFHKKNSNYISFSFSIMTSMFLIYFLCFYIFTVYF